MWSMLAGAVRKPIDIERPGVHFHHRLYITGHRVFVRRLILKLIAVMVIPVPGVRGPHRKPKRQSS